MAVKDIRSNLSQIVAVVVTGITGNGVIPGAIIDTANFELGLMFAIDISAYVNGTYSIRLTESDDAGMASPAIIGGDKLIGTIPILTAATAAGGTLPTVGIIGNLRYVLASIVTSGHTSGTTNVGVHCIQKAENMPV